MNLYLDTETYNEADISVGTYRYAETAEIMLLTYAIDDGPVHCIDFTDESRAMTAMEVRLLARDFSDFETVTAHNAMFDRNVLRLGNLKVEIPTEKWRCTMVKAYCHALPGGLGELCRVLGVPEDRQKIAEGKRLINRFCKPAPSNHKADRYTRHTHPEEWARFKKYGIQDAVAMREVDKRIPNWNWGPDTIAEYHLDQKINDRGFAVDQELVAAGARAAIREKALLAERFAELTGGLRPSQRAQVQAFLNERYSLNLAATAKHVMLPLSKDPTVPAEVREIASITLDANKTSTAKYATLEAALSSDGRFRGGIQFAGARRTRRGAGRVFQPQNLPSRGLPKNHLIEAYIDALKADAHDLLFDDLMLYGAAALRGVVTT